MKKTFTLPDRSSRSHVTATLCRALFQFSCLCWAIIFLPGINAQAATLPANFAETRLASGLDPTGMEFAPDGRLFVTEKSGEIRIVKNGKLLATPFMRLSVNNDNERGLLGIAFDPNFESNQYVYVYYTTSSKPIHNRVSRFVADGDVVVPGSETVLLDLDNLSAGNHNGGGIFFNGGKLFILAGENAKPEYSQDLDYLLGKILRINADGSIPSDNPFYTKTTGKNRAIWAIGLRNPFKGVVQPGTGRIFINDVGASRYEEINEGEAGRNYGWPGIEGTRTSQQLPSNYKDPVYTYGRNVGCSITGGTFYNPETELFPASYVGKYFFTDYCSGFIKVLDFENDKEVTTFATGINRPIDVKVGPDGSLYYLARGGIGGGTKEDNTSSDDGELWRVRFTNSNVPTISAQPTNQTVATGEAVTFTVGASGTGLSYQWQRNGQNINGATDASYTIPSVTQSDNGATFRAVVSNSSGKVTSNGALLTVSINQPPTARILTPTDGSLYKGGQVISVSGAGTDPEDGNLPASAFSWHVTFHHATHTHPGPLPVVAADGRSGTFTIPTEGETATDVWFRVFLTVTDSKGTKTTTSVDIQPKLVTLTMETKPTNLQVLVEGQPQTAPYSRAFVVGTLFSLSTASQTRNGVVYTFTNWSSGLTGGRVTVPDKNTTYTANFTNDKDESGGNDSSDIVSGATYSITAKHSGKVLGVANASTSDGAAVQQMDYTGENHQKWILTVLKSGNYSIKSVHSGKAIDIKGFSKFDGATAIQWTARNSYNQEFKLVDAGEGYYQIIARHSDRALDVYGESLLDGTPVVQWENSGADNQKFRLTKLSDPGAREAVAASSPSEPSDERILTVYPNPADQTVTVSGAKDGTVQIIDLLGTVRSTVVSPTEQLTVDVSRLPVGPYIIQTKTNKRVVNRKLIISR